MSVSQEFVQLNREGKLINANTKNKLILSIDNDNEIYEYIEYLATPAQEVRARAYYDDDGVWTAWITIGRPPDLSQDGRKTRKTFEAYGDTLNNALDSLSGVIEEEEIETTWIPPQDF